MVSHCIAIMTAMGMEFNYVKKAMKIKKTRRKKGFKMAIYGAGDSRFILIKTGMGMKKARRATRFLLDNFNINAVINIGIAGALKPGLKTGDLVLGHEVLIEKNTGQNQYKVYPCRDSMVEMIRQAPGAAENTKNTGNRWYSGRIVSVQKGIGSRERKHSLYRQFNAHAVDMEAGAIIDTCDDIPFVTVKSISDQADESIGISENVMTDEGKMHPGKIIRMLVTHPLSTISRARSIMKNMKLALTSLEFIIKGLPGMVETSRKRRNDSNYPSGKGTM